MKFEYCTTFSSMPYVQGPEPSKLKKIVFGKEGEIPTYPDISGFLGSEEHQKQLNEMGSKGWELVSVQQVLRGMYQYNAAADTSYGFGYSLTAGFMFFWKKTKDY